MAAVTKNRNFFSGINRLKEKKITEKLGIYAKLLIAM
jgi:hypothetical protein